MRAISRSLQSGGPPIGDLADAGGATYSAAPDAAQQGLAPGVGILGVPASRRAYDEIDFAAPSTGAVETTFSLSQSLWTKPMSPGHFAPGGSAHATISFRQLPGAAAFPAAAGASGGNCSLAATSARRSARPVNRGY